MIKKELGDRNGISKIIDKLMDKFKDDISINETLQVIEDEFGVKKKYIKEFIEKSKAIKQLKNHKGGSCE